MKRIILCIVMIAFVLLCIINENSETSIFDMGNSEAISISNGTYVEKQTKKSNDSYIKFNGKKGHNYLVCIEGLDNSDYDCEVYCKGGNSITIYFKGGHYKVSYKKGKTWYGNSKKLGATASTIQVNGVSGDLYLDGWGYEVDMD